MEKLTKDLYIQHAKRLQAIISEQSQFAKYIGKADFANILQSQLNMLFALQNKFKNEKVVKAEQLVKIFNKITKKEFNLNEKFKLNDDADYIDSMNYLVTYCSNIYKVNIDDLVKGKKVSVAEPNVQIRPEMDESIENDQSAFGAGMAMGMGANFMDPKQNPFIVGQASAKLQKEIISGQFYRFKTKPKAIPIIKWIATILVMLTSLGLILMSIFAFMTHGIRVLPSGAEDPQQLSTITDGIFFLLFAGIGVYNTVTFFKTNLSQNPNDKFYFSWQILLIFIIGAIFAVLFCINGIFELGFSYYDGTHTQILGKNAWHYIWFVNISLTVLCIVPIVVGSILNPKTDTGAMDKRLGEIIDSLVAGYGANKTTKPDMQKPVDVKKKDDKQEDKKKK